MSETINQHLSSEIEFVEEKIKHLSGIIDSAYHNEIGLYFTRQQNIMHGIRNELYNLANKPMAELVSPTKSVGLNSTMASKSTY